MLVPEAVVTGNRSSYVCVPGDWLTVTVSVATGSPEQSMLSKRSTLSVPPAVAPDGPVIASVAESCTVVPASIDVIALWSASCTSVVRPLVHDSPVGAGAKSLSVASIAGDDRDSVIKVAIHGSSRPRPVRSTPISEKVGGATVALAGLPSLGSHSVVKEPGPLQGGGFGSLFFGAIVHVVVPLTRPHRSSPGAV